MKATKIQLFARIIAVLALFGATQHLTAQQTFAQLPIGEALESSDADVPALSGEFLGLASRPRSEVQVDPLSSVDGEVALIGYDANCDVPCDNSGACATCDTCDTCGGCDSGCGNSCCLGGCLSCGCVSPAPCTTCPRVNLASPYFNINFTGAVILDMLFSEARAVAPGTPFYLTPSPQFGFDENTFDMHARQTQFGASLAGPQFGGFQSGGLVLATLYNDAVIVDRYGFLPLQAYGELKNQDWRFSAGLQFDVFNPRAPTVLPFSILNASGNAGNAMRGQLRVERYIRPSSDRQWTIQMALSDPVSTLIDPEVGISEDAGWPNLEGRVALGCGCPVAGQRPFEAGLSGVVGELREVTFAVSQTDVNVWGVGADLFWRVSEAVGINAEVFTGQGLGTYNAGVLQGVNPVTGEGIQTSGGFVEGFVYLSQCVHTHFGYGVDDPKDEDVNFFAGRTYNETYFANLIWDVNPTFRVAGELAWRNTDWVGGDDVPLLDNEGIGFHTQFQWRF